MDIELFSDEIRERERRRRRNGALWSVASFILHVALFAVIILMTPVKSLVFEDAKKAPKDAAKDLSADRIDQVACRGEVPDRLGDEGLAERQPVAGRAAVADPAVGGHVVLRRAKLADGHELPMLLVEFADLVLQHGEQPRLDALPEFAKGSVFRCRLHAPRLLRSMCTPVLSGDRAFITYCAAIVYNYFQKNGGVDKLSGICEDTFVR